MLNDDMRNSQKGLAHLTVLFVLAILLIATAWISRQQTPSSLQAQELPQDYFGILRENNFYDCESGYHLVNLEEDEVAHCLIVPSGANLREESLEEFVNQNVKAYGTLSEIGGKRYLFLQSLEKTPIGFLPSLKSKFLDVLGSFIKKFTNLHE